MVKFPASYVSSLEGTSLKINMSPEKGTISKRKVVFQSSLLRGCYVDFFGSTLPKTNTAPENRPLEKEIPIGHHHF